MFAALIFGSSRCVAVRCGCAMVGLDCFVCWFNRVIADLVAARRFRTSVAVSPLASHGQHKKRGD
jgi:hypothetical protein